MQKNKTTKKSKQSGTKALIASTSMITLLKIENSKRVIDLPDRLATSLVARYERSKKIDASILMWRIKKYNYS